MNALTSFIGAHLGAILLGWFGLVALVCLFFYGAGVATRDTPPTPPHFRPRLSRAGRLARRDARSTPRPVRVGRRGEVMTRG